MNHDAPTDVPVTTAARPAARWLSAVFSIAYPLTAHMAVARESVLLTSIAMFFLGLAALLPALANKKAGAWIALAILCFGCWYLAKRGTDVAPLFFPTILMPTFLAWLFGHTLLHGRTPLIARIAKLSHPHPEEIDPAVWPYARRLTFAWTALFIVIALTNFTLATFSEPRGLLLAIGVTPSITVPMELWSWFANVVSHGIVAGFFVGEYVYRKRRFPDQPYRNFFDFLEHCIAAGPKLLHS